MKIEKFIEGTPKAQPRPRGKAFTRTDTKGNKYNSTMVYNPNTADAWKIQIKSAFIHHTGRNIEGPIICNMVFLLPRPQKLNRKKDPAGRIPHTAKPDKDNLEKAVMDCLSAPIKKKKGKSFILVGGIGVWHDDAQVYCGTTQKYYCAKDEQPGALVTILWGE